MLGLSTKPIRWFLVFSFIFLALSAYSFLNNYSFASAPDVKTSPGTVIENVRKHEKEASVYPKVIFRHADGTDHTFLSNQGSSPALYEVNESVTVIYRGDDVRIRSFSGLYLNSVVLLGIGLVFLGLWKWLPLLLNREVETKSENPEDLRGFIIIFLGMGLALLGYGAYDFWQNWQWTHRDGAVHTTGTIVGFSEGATPSRQNTRPNFNGVNATKLSVIYLPEFSVQIAGATQTFKAAVGASEPGYKIGEKVPVVCYANDCQMQTFLQKYFGIVIFGGFGVLLVSMAGAVHWKVKDRLHGR